MFSFQLQQVYKQLNVKILINSMLLHTEGAESQNSLKQIGTRDVYLEQFSRQLEWNGGDFFCSLEFWEVALNINFNCTNFFLSGT